MVRKSVSFESQGLECAAYLYLPDTEEKRPVIVMAHGLGGIREMRLDSFAEEFCKVGYACVLFDYRYFGASEGTPRQLLDIESQIQDWKAAIDYARHCLEVDHEKVIIWGSSFSGGHVIRLASEDKNIFAAMSQCPFTDGFASAATSNLFTSVKLGALAIADLVGSKFGRDPIYVPLAGEPSSTAFMTAPDCLQGYLNLVPDNEDKARFENKCAARLALQLSTAFPGKRAKDVECPILVCVCDKDTLAPAETTIAHVKKAKKVVVKQYPYGHFEIYLGDPFETVLKDQLDFLKKVAGY